MRLMLLLIFIGSMTHRSLANRVTIALPEKPLLRSNSFTETVREITLQKVSLELETVKISIFDLGEGVPLSRAEELAATLLERRWINGIAQVFSQRFARDDMRMGATFTMNLDDKFFHLRYRFNF